MHHIDVEFEDAARSHGALRDFGFDESVLARFIAEAAPGEEPGRVVEARRGRCKVVCAPPSLEALPFGEDPVPKGALPFGDEEADGPGGKKGPVGALGRPRALREIEATQAGAAASAAPPVAGDWVLLSSADGPRWDRALVRGILPRTSAITRKAPGETAHDRVEAQVLAANVDAAFIVIAAGRDWNPRRLERYLVLARDSGVEPVVVVTKADLAGDPDALEAEAIGIAGDARCVLVCAPEGLGLDRLRESLGAGRTIVLLGSSGAGKSTLLNALAGRELARTGAVRSDDQRGRHTTTQRQLYRLPLGDGASSALVIDTPGLRELQLWCDEEAVDAAFPDIEKLAGLCRFRDCRHDSEPGCAVRAALESGELDAGRYEGWRKLSREAAFLKTREDPTAQRDEDRRWKIINKSMRGYTKERRSIQGRAR